MRPRDASIVAAGITAALVILSLAYYYGRGPWYGYRGPLPAVPTHVPSFARVARCQTETTERAFDDCMGLGLRPARILRSGPYYSRSLGFKGRS